MRFLDIYRNILPNTPYNTYLVPTSKASFLSYMSTFIERTIEVDNYRIEAESIIILSENSFNEDMTYFIERDNEDDEYLRCYQIDAVTYQSGKVYINVHLDIWGTYIYKLNFQRLHLIKTSRISSTALLPKDLDVKTSDYQATSIANDTDNKVNSADYGVLIYLDTFTFNEIQTGSEHYKVNSIIPVYIGLNTILADFGTAVATYGLINCAAHMVSNIYQVTSTNFDKKAAVTRAYIVKRSWIKTQSGGNITCKSKLFMGNSADAISFTDITFTCNRITSDVTIERYYRDTSDYTKQYFIGTYFEHVPLKAYCNTTEISLRVTIDYTNLRCEILEGSKSYDFTKALSLTLVGNSESETMQDAIMRNIGLGAKALLMIGSAIVTKGASLALTGAATAISGGLDIAKQIIPNNTASPNGQVSEGNAYTTFSYFELDGTLPFDKLRAPFYLIAYDINANVQEYIRQNGLDCNDDYSTWAMLFYATTPIVDTAEVAYIKGAMYGAEGAPKFAQDEINNILMQGCKVQYINE